MSWSCLLASREAGKIRTWNFVPSTWSRKEPLFPTETHKIVNFSPVQEGQTKRIISTTGTPDGAFTLTFGGKHSM